MFFILWRKTFITLFGIKLKPRRRHKNANDFKLCYFVSPFVDFHAIWLFNENENKKRFYDFK